MKVSKSLFSILFVVFIDYLGFGLIYPLFSAMLLDSSCPLLPMETSQSIRGLWLGVLFCLMPLFQFLTSSFWGSCSDRIGRKKPLIGSLCIGLLGYLTAFIGIVYYNLPLLLFSRVLIGCAAGNTSISLAAIVDVSTKETKTKNFGLYSMAFGAGFTLGPLLSGLATWNRSLPFFLASLLVLLNLLFTIFYFTETNNNLVLTKTHWIKGLTNISKAFSYKDLRILFLCSFLNYFGWYYFFEFAPLFLITRFQFSLVELSFFFGLSGAFYALSTGLLIRPLIRKYRPEMLFLQGLLWTALCVLFLPFIPQSFWLWPLLFLICYFTSFTSPTSSTLLSDAVSDSSQGEMLGILNSVNTAAMILSPLLSGACIGPHPGMPMWIGGSTLLLAAIIYFFCSYKISAAKAASSERSVFSKKT